MADFALLFSGPMSREYLDIGFKPRFPRIHSEAGPHIASAWDQALTLYRAQGRRLFNGTLTRLVSARKKGEKLVLELGLTDYRTYFVTRDSSFRAKFPECDPADPIAVNAVLVTRDETILIDPRTGVDVYPGWFDLVGGFMDPTLDLGPDAQPDPFLAVQREVAEELGFSGTLKDLRLLGLAYDLVTPHPEFCFSARLDLTSREVRARLGTLADGEIQDLKILPHTAEDLKSFMISHDGRIAPTALAGLILHGREFFGCDWAEGLPGFLHAQIGR